MYIPRKLLISVAATCAMAGGLAAKTDKPSHTDDHFISEAAQGGQAEVQLGRLAADKAASPQVKQFGQRMVADHSKANGELTNIASQRGINLPNKLDKKDQKQYDHLAKLNGQKFDKAYMSYMVKDHKKDVSAFKHEADHGNNPDLKNFASQTQPILQQHLQMAQQTKSEVK